jgi:hypothetical protein
MAKIVKVDFPCSCQNGTLTFTVKKQGFSFKTVSYELTGTATCPSCGRTETIKGTEGGHIISTVQKDGE